MEILLLLFSIIMSILLIAKGSDWLTDSLEPLAKHLKTSKISIGLILVSIAVSLPEILVAVSTGLKGHQDISLGVAFGSIICNIGLMIGLPALLRPLKVPRTLLLRDGIFSVVVPILVFAISQNGDISRLDGLSMFLLFIPYLTNVYLQEKRESRKEQQTEKREIVEELKYVDFYFGKIKAGFLSFLSGVVLLLIGTQLFSDQLIKIVDVFKLDSLFIGLTLGAFVPSIPNILAAYKATVKGFTDVAVSETLGSNIFTLLVTVGIVAMIKPVKMGHRWITFDIPMMIGISFLLFFFMITNRTISRREGIILLSFYVGTLILQTILFSH